MAGISYLVLLQVLYLVFSPGMADDAEVLADVSTTDGADRNRVYSSCHKWFPADDMKDRCRVIEDATANLETALDTIKERDLHKSNFESGPDHEVDTKAMQARMDCLKNFINKMDTNQGYSVDLADLQRPKIELRRDLPANRPRRKR